MYSKYGKYLQLNCSWVLTRNNKYDDDVIKIGCETISDGVFNSLGSHPLELDSTNHSGNLHMLNNINSDSKKVARDPESAAGGVASHGACLTLNDHDRIRQFIQEFTLRGLLPHIEKNIRQLNDQVHTHSDMQIKRQVIPAFVIINHF